MRTGRGKAARGFQRRIRAVDASAVAGSLDPHEPERRLLEIGRVECARVEIRHEGLFGQDPIAVRVDSMTVALRRREANAIFVEPMEPPAP